MGVFLHTVGVRDAVTGCGQSRGTVLWMTLIRCGDIVFVFAGVKNV